ncbi:MAG TPA: bifunctional glutamate N-acetyltransferase/amino-acid acetyltransferase ArgJ [Acidimicrobiales bacterium]|nr:bifunctional glutamate N-acetyltransferase/amino-acid acetyltransferase ArgJ [Acidimicrobiales bacterium]
MSVTAPEGFVASGVAAGIKEAGALDMALVATEDGVAVPAAAVFTTNRAAAAPVQVSRRHLRQSGGRAAAVVLTSGNANAATGAPGTAAAERLCERSAEAIGAEVTEVLVCQTGLIGVPFPIDVAGRAVADLAARRTRSPEAGAEAATAIMTTDTVRKEVVVEGDGFTVGAMAKGAAMLAPDMATMLAVLTTDARCERAALARSLHAAVAGSFNALTVDSCTSTNDTVIVLASGRGRAVDGAELSVSLGEACTALTEAMAADAEGATKVVRVLVTGAASDADAHRAARQVAGSPLVKCSMNGADPYWGRVVSELGTAAAAFDLDRVSVAYGGVVVCQGGVAAPHDAAAVAAHMAGTRVDLVCDLGLGSGAGAVLTTDLGYGYIDENRTTS